MTKNVFIGIGSNMGNRKEHIRKALSSIDQISPLISVSKPYRSKPYGVVNQPDFINLVAECRVEQEPIEYLKLLQNIELEGERVTKQKWHARTIDLDILFFGNMVMVNRDLVIPHPDLHNRDFVLRPLMDIASEFIHPVLKMTVKEIYELYVSKSN